MTLAGVFAGVLQQQGVGGGGNALETAILALTPVGYWKLDETSGTAATDLSGNGYHGTYTGTYTLAGNTGDDSTGYVDLGGGYITISDQDDFSIVTTGELTVIALVNPDSVSGTTRQFIASKGSADNYEWAQHLNFSVANRLESNIWGYTGSTYSGERLSSALTAGAWHLVGWSTNSVTFGDRHTVYRDSDIPATTTGFTSGSTPAPANRAAPVIIGQRGDFPTGQSWMGGIAHVAIFASKLGDAQVSGIRTAALSDGWTV